MNLCFQKVDPIKMQNQSLLPRTFSSEAVLDHLGVNERPLLILNDLNIL